MERFAVILTHNRPDLLRQTWAAVGPQVDMVIVIDNASSPPIDADLLHSGSWHTAVLGVATQPPNLSAMWNLGVASACDLYWASESKAPLYVAVLCDDAPPPPGWFDAVTEAMSDTGAAIGCSAPEPFGWVGPPVLKRERDSDLSRRMPGWAFIVDPVSGVRADERFEYWWGDTDLDWAARAAGGMVIIGSHPVPNLVDNGWTGKMIDQIAVDSQRFVDKHGYRPW